jgi:hypothetical protein
MDGRRFDHLARLIGSRASRRGAVKALAGGGAAALLVGLGVEEAAAACKASNKECSRDRQCCSLDCRRNQCRCAREQERCKSAKGCCQGEDVTNCRTSLGLVGDRCCREAGRKCSETLDCCGNLACNQATGQCF